MSGEERRIVKLVIVNRCKKIFEHFFVDKSVKFDDSYKISYNKTARDNQVVYNQNCEQ